MSTNINNYFIKVRKNFQALGKLKGIKTKLINAMLVIDFQLLDAITKD